MSILSIAILILVVPLVAGGGDQQDPVDVASSFRGARGRVVIPAQLEIDERVARNVLTVLDNQGPLAGFPPHVSEDLPITITIVTSPYPDRDAWSFPGSAVIALPAERLLDWTEEKLHRILRHELAHIWLGRYFFEVRLPVWFREGFAEWAAGGLSCEQKARLHMNIALQRAHQAELPRLGDSTNAAASRREYDLFASFFEFVEMRFPEALTSGALLAAVKARGVSVGFRHALGVELDELERDWQAYLLGEYVEAEMPACK